jgi:hypothetical protein
MHVYICDNRPMIMVKHSHSLLGQSSFPKDGRASQMVSFMQTGIDIAWSP